MSTGLCPLDQPVLSSGPVAKIIGSKVVRYAAVSSTMDAARDLAIGGAEEGTVVLAEKQTGGRGRLGRRWLAPPGTSILMSIVLRPPIEKLTALNMVAALAVARAIEQATGLEARIKWPNDVLIDSRKVCGILLETDIARDKVNWVIVGIGLNVNLDVAALPEMPTPPTSLSTALGRKVDKEELLRALLLQLDKLYQALLAGQPVRQLWLERLDTLGKEVTVTIGDTVERGVAESVDDQGSLLLRRADGSLAVIVAGDVTLRPRG